MENVPVATAAEALLELFKANGVDYIFFNPGTDHTSIMEAASKYKVLKKRAPEMILCLDEFVAMSAAHGYFMVSGKPQVVLVHVDVGTLQVGGALSNAQQDRVGMVFCAGLSPSIFEGERPGGREFYVYWYQDPFDQAGIVRNYVKWTYQLRSNDNAHHVIRRAFQVAATEPCGPVYLALPRELLMEERKSTPIPDPSRYPAALTPEADHNMLRKAAEVLSQAENPMIITSYSGRNTQSVVSLVELSETLGIRVITSNFRMNFPTKHPLYSGFDPHPYLKDADAILLIDVDVPYIPTRATLRQDVTIIQIDIDPIKQDKPIWGFPVDIPLQADSSKTIPVLIDMLRQMATPEQRDRWQARRQKLEKENKQLRARWDNLAITKAEQKPISVEWLCHCINEAVDEDDIVLHETLTSDPSVQRQVHRTRPGTLFSKLGTGLGWGLGAALGAKLAAPGKTVVSLMGDGSFNFACPIPALLAAYRYKAPFLCIIFDNEGYQAPGIEHSRIYGEDSYLGKTDVKVGVDFVTPPNYVLIAEACYAYGQMVSDPSDLKTALKQALEQVRSGKVVLLDVKIEKPLPR